ncbi:MAG: hypothetical protein K0R18_6 [Bacillales bacterium]|jgi:hypothetical protein|nr:hypothetical protein [Bacillales bacterium]
MANDRNEYVAQENSAIQVNPKNAMEQFKTEVASELGLKNYNSMDKGWLASRQNGYVGGNMTKKMVAYAEQAIAQQGAQTMQNVRSVVEVTPEVRRMNELASQDFNGYVQALQTGNIGQLASGTQELH